MLDLDPIKARLDAACPGPWKGGTLRDPLTGDCYMLVRAHDPSVVAATLRPQYGDNDTAVMLLHSRADMDAMVAEIERLRAENVELRKERPAVVAYLREGAGGEQGQVEYADDIERGDHLPEEET